jgi:hypothetical protein
LAALAIVAGALWLPAMAGKNEIIEKYQDKTFYLQSNLHIDGNSASWVNYIGSADFVGSRGGPGPRAGREASVAR